MLTEIWARFGIINDYGLTAVSLTDRPRPLFAEQLVTYATKEVEACIIALSRP